MAKVRIDKKCALFIAGIIMLTVNIETAFSAPEEESIEKGNYSIKISHDEQRKKSVKENKPIAKIECGCETGPEIKHTMSGIFTTTIKEEQVRELAAALGIEFGIGFRGVVDLKGKTELINKLKTETSCVGGNQIEYEVTIIKKMEPLDCFNQSAYILCDHDIYEVEMEKKGWFWDKLFGFDWVENINCSILIEAKYDDACKNCQILGKKEPVKGEGDKDLWAFFLYKKERIYLVPLYWDENWRIINPINFLPEKVKKEFTSE